MIQELRKFYGVKVGEVSEIEFYSFPTIAQLSDARESDLREIGMGYRAKFITNSARMLLEDAHKRGILKEESHLLLENLKTISRQEAIEYLIKFPGVGRKVADCIALFSLDKFDCVPVDTHVWDIAKKFYSKQLRARNASGKKTQTLTDSTYSNIRDVFIDIYGPQAGWAHSVLFTAELRAFQNKITEISTGEEKSKLLLDSLKQRKRRRNDVNQ